ncbi:hypothetical protein AVEN_99886-1 [Araneus ventricosus]|uniref:Uncharacterized protein n=1 Tax=Araneus ventricosus TaxID=182803 RepID=A0A4Y2QB96_ARAVE|nr:hypothetical protein AVEN_99886-1 [Araneus ventricosus]
MFTDTQTDIIPKLCFSDSGRSKTCRFVKISSSNFLTITILSLCLIRIQESKKEKEDYEEEEDEDEEDTQTEKVKWKEVDERFLFVCASTRCYEASLLYTVKCLYSGDKRMSRESFGVALCCIRKRVNVFSGIYNYV